MADIRDVEDIDCDHALLGASRANRWLNCTPSARMTEDMDDRTSVFAQEGTLAHELGELMLQLDLKLITKRAYNSKLKLIKANELYDEEMPDQVEKYTNYVFERLAEAKSHTKDPLVFLEQRLDFSDYVPEGFGTGDCTIIADGALEIIDLKYGKGVEVFAEENPQMKLYALGALSAYDFIYDIDTVRMTIAQPRLNNFSSWELSVKDLLDWAVDEVQPKAMLAWEGKGETVAGDWCIWCKVKGSCKARAEKNLELAKKYNYQDPNLLNVDEIAEILKQADEIQKWAKDVQDFALEQARDNGVKYEGWKLVEGRSNRRYADPDAIKALLVKEGFEENKILKPAELLGITALTKAITKKKFDSLLTDLVIKPEGKPTLVPESDKRKEINSAASDFDL